MADEIEQATTDALRAHHESITELERVTDEVLEKFEELRDGQRALEARASKQSGEMLAIRTEIAALKDSQNKNFETILTQLRRLTPIPPR